MSEVLIKAEVREKSTKGQRNEMRRNGYVPAVLYGADKEPVTMALLLKDLDRVWQQGGAKGLLTLQLTQGDNKASSTPVMIKESQTDPLKGTLTHIDFYRVNLKEKLTVEVSIVLTGDAAGEKEGGMLQQHMRTLELECLPTNIPQEIYFDISELEIGDSVLVSELPMPEGSELITEGDSMVANVTPPRLEEEPDEEEAVEDTPEAEQAE